MRKLIDLEDDVIMELRILAAKSGVSLKIYIEQLLNKVVEWEIKKQK